MSDIVDMSDLARNLAKIIQELIDRGWQSPICFAALGTNGFVQTGAYAIDEEAQQWTFQNGLSQMPADEEDIRLPINIMLVNTEGEAVRVVLSSKNDKLEYRFSEN